jgi:putative phosphoribosyl transferase
MFQDRIDAGKRLAMALSDLRDSSVPIVVLAIPRGGVVVGREVADALHAPLDVCLTRKIGAPSNPELAIGAVAEDGTLLLDDEMVKSLWVAPRYLDEEIAQQRREMERRATAYRHNRKRVPVSGHVVVVVDDGIATGSTMFAALRSVRTMNAHQVIAAVPVGPAETVQRMEREADRVVVLEAPRDFWAVGLHYRRFDQVTDEEVIKVLSAE